MAHHPGTLADVVAGHVTLEIEGLNRIYVNGRVPALQTSGQVAGWLIDCGVQQLLHCG